MPGFLKTRILLPLLALTLLSSAGCSDPEPLVSQADTQDEHVLFRDVRTVDVRSGVYVNKRDVLVSGSRITRITDGGTISPPPGTRVVNAKGFTMVPGLIDAHAHVSQSPEPFWNLSTPDPEANLRSFLFSGVTTVLDASGPMPESFTLRNAVRHGEILGPNLFTAGPMVTVEDGHPVPLFNNLVPWWIRWYMKPRMIIELQGPDSIAPAVTRLKNQRADFAKVAVDSIPETAPRMDEELLGSFVKRAAKIELRTLAHIGSTEDAMAAGSAGVSAWMHGVYKERIPDEAISVLADFGIPMVATLVVFQQYGDLGHRPRESTALERATVAAETLEEFANPPSGFAPDDFRGYLDTLRATEGHRIDNIRRLHKAGVTILAGSDNQSGIFPGASLHRELALLTEAGLKPAEALRAATLYSAAFLEGLDIRTLGSKENPGPSFGEVAQGSRADILLVQGEPLENIRDLENIRMVMLNGRVLHRHPLSR